MPHTRQFFPKTLRLKKPVEFTNAFASGKKYRSRAFTITVTANQLTHPRLGLAISRRAAAKAVDRNRIKRIVRESFRCNASTLRSIDIVVQATLATSTQSSQSLSLELSDLWVKLT
ncbi:MAG: ribonuclease P protein component [Proteobacteria bacterium]|nr:ribonuclease P protein component [Pseudomonadota bacterium]